MTNKRWKIEKVQNFYHIKRNDCVGSTGFKVITIMPVNMLVSAEVLVDNPKARFPQLSLKVKTKTGDLLFV